MLYLEISNIAAAIKKNPYELYDKTLLHCWARNDKKNCLKFLIENGYIEQSDEKVINIDFDIPDNLEANNLKKYEEKIISDIEIKNKLNSSEKDEVKKIISDTLKKELGNQKEEFTINYNKLNKGNDKMYYFNISDNSMIGGKHDSIQIINDEEIVVEIKSRTRKNTIRKNEYDLCQLIGYLLAMNKTKGKIIQNYLSEIYDSDNENSKEYGIIDINKEPYLTIKNNIISELNNFFEDIENIIKTQNINLNSIKKPFAIIKDNEIIEIDNKYKRIVSFLN